MGLEYKVVSDSKDFRLQIGDYVLDEDSDNVYIVSTVGYGFDESALISIVDGGRWTDATNLGKLRSHIVEAGFKVYRKGNIKIELSSPIYE